jgi:uncharacterized membrane protein YfcA
MFLEMFTIVGALTGAAITLSAGDRSLHLLFGAVLVVSWVGLWRECRRWTPARHQDRLSQWLELRGRYYDKPLHRWVDYRAVRAWAGGPLMFGAGMIAGLLGIGAGALKVVIHELVMGLPPKVSTTTSNLIIGVTALGGTSVYLAAGLIDPALAAPVILGVTAGAFVGTRMLVRLTNEAVRRVFHAVLIVLAAEMIVRGIRA